MWAVSIFIIKGVWGDSSYCA